MVEAISSTVKKEHVLPLLVFALWTAGCSGPPPDHCANWWHYWRDGTVVADMDSVKYLWGEKAPLGVSSPHKSTEIVGVHDRALSECDYSWSVRHKDYPSVNKSIKVVEVRDGGIDGVAEVIAHEHKHIWVYTQWGCPLYSGEGQLGVVNGWMHSDRDAIPDVVEADRTPGSLWAHYEFDPDDPDTYRLAELPGWSVYATYGDNEVLARVEGVNSPRYTVPSKDWSFEGKQWGQ